MSSLELIITNAPPKFVRARYARESRGFITGENGKKVQLQVRNNTEMEQCFDGAKCTGEVKSVATKQPHNLYSLRKSVWDVTIEKNGSVKVDLDHLAVEINSGRNRRQRSDRGKFYLEFKLIFANGNVGASCRTEDMLDESCKETCRPTIKTLNPQCGMAGEEVWVQCYNNVAKIKSVMAILSYMINGHEHQFFADCDIDGKLVKFKLPSLYDKIPPAERTELQLRIIVDKDEDTTSDKVKFGYLAAKFNRPKATQSDFDEAVRGEKFSRKRKVDGDNSHSKTFDSKTIIELLSPNQDNEFAETAEPKCMSHSSISKQENSFKAFSQGLQNPLLDEKRKSLIIHPPDDVPHEVILQTHSKTIQDFIPEQDYTIASSLQARVTIPEKQLRDSVKSCLPNIRDETSRPREQENPILSLNHDHVKNMVLPEMKQGIHQVNISPYSTNPYFGYSPTCNNTDMYHSADSSLLALSSLPPLCESNLLLENSDTHDDPSIDFTDLYQLHTVFVSKNGIGDTFEDNAVSFTGSDTKHTMAVSMTIPDRYAAHDHNPCHDACESEQPMEKILKMG